MDPAAFFLIVYVYGMTCVIAGMALTHSRYSDSEVFFAAVVFWPIVALVHFLRSTFRLFKRLIHDE